MNRQAEKSTLFGVRYGMVINVGFSRLLKSAEKLAVLIEPKTAYSKKSKGPRDKYGKLKGESQMDC